MRFATPLALILLLLLPAFALLGWPRRGWASGREMVSLVLRLVIVASLVLALAGLEVVRAAGDLAVVFLLDVSDSVSPADQAAGAAWVQAALEEMGPDDLAAVVVFGDEALVERPLSPARELGPIGSIPTTTATDLGEAIRLGAALLPTDAARRLVILSDGLDTSGEALAAARLAAASGVQIAAVPVGDAPEDEVLLTGVDAPANLQQGEEFELELEVQSSRALTADVRVLANGVLVFQGEQRLQRGQQTFSLSLVADQPGFTRFQVLVDPQADGYYQNNELSAYSQVGGPPRVLVVAPEPGEDLPAGEDIRPDEAAGLVAALRSAGYEVDLVRPSALGSNLTELAPYASVVLVDVPARELRPGQMETLQTYVRDLGGGLVAIGGPTSYGVGGYYRTPLEEILPVEMQIRDEQRRPTLTMVFVIDHSGSMSETSGGASKLEMAKEAAIRSIELMFPSDRVGVVAFDENATWVAPVTELSNPQAVINATASLRSGGGTDILAGVQAVAGELPGDPASLKHVILLTDGGADPTGIPELVESLRADYGITLSTVGVGRDAAPFLEDLAELGGGRYHFAADPRSIPSIFTEETALAARSYIVEHRFFPEQVSPSPILSGIQEVPPLEGYVATSPKAAAQLVLVSDLDDPVLAAWQYGLGRAVAFTSDAAGRWAQNWLAWEDFAQFWSQAVRFTLQERTPSTLEVRVEESGDTARLVVSAQAEDGAYLNGYRMQANMVTPDGEAQVLDLEQVAPGLYVRSFEPAEPGAYLVAVTGEPPEAGEPGAVAETTGWVLSYSPEYRRLGVAPEALAELAGVTGGQLLTGSPGTAFAHNLPAGRATRPAWPWLLLLAAVLLPLDVAVRRLMVTPAEVQQRLARRVGRQPAVSPPAARSSHMESLLRAKQRASGAPPEEIPEKPSAPPRAQERPARQPSVEAEPEAGAGQEPRVASPRSTAANLLDSKRQKRDKQ